MTRTRLLLVAVAILVIGAGALLVSGTDSPSAAAEPSPGGATPPPLPVEPPPLDFDLTTGVANLDGSIIVDARPQLDTTVVAFLDGADGTVLAWRRLDASFELRAVSTNGHDAALVAFDGESSVIALVSLETSRPPQLMTLAGRVEPEAFSTDETTLFVIDHEASDIPGGYRVRPLDLATGELGRTLGPDKRPLNGDMNGVGRRQVSSPTGARLYTLYTRQGSREGQAGAYPAGKEDTRPTEGFIHVLDLREEWAFCIELPSDFGTGESDTAALAVAPDDSQVAVVDLEAGKVAWASTDSLEVLNVVELPADLDLSAPVYAALTDDELVVGSGNQVYWLDKATLELLAPPSTTPIALVGLSGGGSGVIAWSSGNTINVPHP